MNFIEWLHNKPRFVRIQILWISVILTMTIIFFFWLVYLKSSLQLSSLQDNTLQEQAIPSLFGTIREDFSFFKKNLQAEINEALKRGKEEKDFDVEIIKPSKLPD